MVNPVILGVADGSFPYVLGASGTGPPQTPSGSTGSFSVPTGEYAVISRRLTLTGSQRVTLTGTATLRLI